MPGSTTATRSGRFGLVILIAFASLLVTLRETAADERPSMARLAAQHAELEKQRHPYLAGPGLPPSTYEHLLAPPTVGPYVSIQANVDACGNNIAGDAANEPSIAVDPTAPNRIVIGWRQFDNVGSDFRQAGRAWSHDGGRTWTFPGVLEPGVFRSDPVLGSDAAGNFYYMSLRTTFNLDLFRSTDGGESFGPSSPAFGGDKEWMAIDNTGGPGDGHIYTAWQLASPFNPNQFTRSTNGGTIFEAPIQLPSRPIFGTLSVDANGALYLSGIDPSDPTGTNFHVLRSDNAENDAVVPTFPVNTTVNLGGALRIFTGPNPMGLLGQPWVATDAASGDVYLLCSVDPPGIDPLDVHIVRSQDGGLTWSAPVRVNDDAAGNEAWQWFGTMSVAPDGRIDVIWNDTRNDPDNPDPTTSELFYSFSTDGGLTWAPNVPVSPAFAHGVGYPQNNKLGDYYHMISDDVGAHLAYAATHNGEQDVWYLRIGGYDCNDNGIADADDISGGSSQDCNANGIPDECEIAAGTVTDTDNNDIPDVCEAIVAALDIKPGSCPNPLNPKSNGVITVAIVGTAGFDVTDIDPATILLGQGSGQGGTLAPLAGPPGPGTEIHDVATPFPGDLCDCHALEGDGTPDLVLKFRTEDIVAALGLGCELPGGEVILEVTGTLFDGSAFVARDCVRIVPVLGMSPSAVVFDAVAPGTTSCQTVTIHNKGIGVVEALSVAGCGGDPFLDTSRLSTTLAPGEKTSFDVCLSGATAGLGKCLVLVSTEAETGSVPVSYTMPVDVTGRLPSVFTVSSPRPNPFNPRVTVEYEVPQPGRVWATVHDVLGHPVRRLLDGVPREAGPGDLVWDGKDDRGADLASGIYLIRLRLHPDAPDASAEDRTVRAVLLR